MAATAADPYSHGRIPMTAKVVSPRSADSIPVAGQGSIPAAVTAETTEASASRPRQRPRGHGDDRRHPCNDHNNVPAADTTASQQRSQQRPRRGHGRIPAKFTEACVPAAATAESLLQPPRQRTHRGKGSVPAMTWVKSSPPSRKHPRRSSRSVPTAASLPRRRHGSFPAAATTASSQQ